MGIQHHPFGKHGRLSGLDIMFAFEPVRQNACQIDEMNGYRGPSRVEKIISSTQAHDDKLKETMQFSCDHVNDR